MRQNVNNLSVLNVYGNAKSVYVFHDGKLQESKPLFTRIYGFEKEEGREATMQVEHTLLLPDGKEYVVTNDDVYKSKEDFSKQDKNDRLEVFKNVMLDDISRNLCSNTLHMQRRDCREFWTFENGEPVCHEIKLNNLRYDYAEERWHDLDLLEYEGQTLYENRAEALSFNEYEIKRQDGTTEKVVGINKLVSLDDDQRGLISQLEQLMNQIRENDIYLHFNCDGGDLMAFNGRNIKRFTVDYGDYSDSEYEEVNVASDAFYVNTHCALDYYNYCDCTLYVKRNTENND